ncbi:GntP family permease [Cetobacterium sp.]|uniref:GntP family permease n=1 Tax=Cetobacterium sp. TaxID=2071632 RepID=UPI003EE4E605
MEAIKQQSLQKNSKSLNDYLGLIVIILGMIYLFKNYMTYSSYFNTANLVLPIQSLTMVAVTGVVILLTLVLVFKVQAFIALMIGSALMGIGTGMAFDDIISSIQNGMGGTLGFVATVVGLGAVYGEMLEASGGAQALSKSLLKKFGKENASWALMATGFLVAIPVFFDVGFIILIPLVYSLAKECKKSVLHFGIPLLAGLAVTHTFMPPTPGPVAVASILGADLGWVILLGAVVGLPTAILAGPVFGTFIGKKIHIDANNFIQDDIVEEEKELPSFKKVLAVLAVPMVLILINTVSTTLVKSGIMQQGVVADLLGFIGNPFIALTISVLIAFYFLGVKEGFSKDMILNLSNKAFGPIGLIILVTGAGGVFKQILVDSGIGKLLAEQMANSSLPILVLAYLIACVVRVTQGSATVAMITAAGIAAPVLEIVDISAPGKALVVISIASGATILSHVNDSGFWLVGRYFGLDVKQTFASWTVMESIISICGFGFSLILSFFL